MKNWLLKKISNFNKRILPIEFLYWKSIYRYRYIKKIPKGTPDFSRMNVLNFYRNYKQEIADRLTLNIAIERFGPEAMESYSHWRTSQKVDICTEALKKTFKKKNRFLNLKMRLYYISKQIEDKLDRSLIKKVSRSKKTAKVYAKMVYSSKPKPTDEIIFEPLYPNETLGSIPTSKFKK